MNKIAELRKKHKLTQEDLARDLGYSRTLITKWERGTVKPTDEQIIMLSKYFEVNRLYFIDINNKNYELDKTRYLIKWKKRFFIIGILESLTYFLILILILIISQFYNIPHYSIIVIILGIISFMGVSGFIVYFIINQKKYNKPVFLYLEYIRKNTTRKEYNKIKNKSDIEIKSFFNKLIIEK